MAKKKRAPRYPLSQTIEVARSFDYKLSPKRYESAGFFCSAKGTTTREKAEEFGDMLDAFCLESVRKSAKKFKAALKLKAAPEAPEPEPEPEPGGDGPLIPVVEDEVIFETPAKRPAEKERNANNVQNTGRAARF